MRNFKYSWQQIAKASFVGIATTATFYLAKTTGLFSSWLSTEESLDVLQESKELDAIPINSGQRRLLQQTAVTVANPVPDQVIQVEQQYTYSVDNVFSGNYTFLEVVETGQNSLPSWLSMQPKLLSNFSAIKALKVLISQNTLLVVDGSYLRIFDASNISYPKLLSTFPAGLGQANGITLSGNKAFLTGGGGTIGLQIVDISNTSNPRLLSTFPAGTNGDAQGVAISGNVAFVADGSVGLQILDVSNTSNPKLLSTFPAGTNGYAQGVAISGNVAFVADGSVGLQILDVSNTSNPKLISTFFVNGVTRGVAVSGNVAFVAAAGLQILNVSNTSNPTLLSTFPAGTNGIAYDVAVSGNLAFLADGPAGLQILNVSNTSNPTLLSTFPAGTNGQTGGIAISDGTVFVGNTNAGLYILDISRASMFGVPSLSLVGLQISLTVTAWNKTDPLAINIFRLTLDQFPRLITSSISDQSIYPGDLMALLLNSDLLFVNPGNSFLKLSVRLGNGAPAPSWLNLNLQPTLLSTFSASASINGVWASGGLAFVASPALKILNVTNPSSPRLLSTLSSVLPRNIALNGTIVFVACSFGQVQILDVSNTSNPRFLSSFSVGAEALGIAISGNAAFIAAGSVGLQIFDVSNASNPRLLSTFPAGTNGKFRAVTLSGSVAFIADSADALQIILDVSNTSNPKLLSMTVLNTSHPYVLYPFAVAVSGSKSFVGGQNVALQIFDVNNQSNPGLLCSYRPGGPVGVPTLGVVVRGNTVFLAESNLGLYILDVSNSSIPQVLSTYSVGTDGSTNGIAVSGNIAFMADSLPGLHIIDLSQWQLTATPGTADVGNYQLQIIATDELGGSASTQPFTIRVEGPPRFNSTIPTQYAKVGQAFNYFIPQGLVSDPNFDPITFTARLPNNQSLPSWLSFSSISAAFVGTPQSSNVGNLTIVLSATDNIAGSSNTSFVLMTNNLPVVNQRLSNTFARVNQFFQLLIPNNTFSHPDGLALNYSAQLSSQAALPSWLRFNATSLFLSGQPNATDAGSYDLRILATDRYAGQASTSFTLSVGNGVQVNRLISSQLAGVGQRYGFAVPSDSFINPDGASFSLQSSALPSWLTFAATTAQFSGTPLASSRGTILINVTATDTTGGSAMQSFNLTVTYFPQVINPITDQVAPIGFVYQLNVSNATFVDQNGYPLTYRAEQTNGQALPNWLAFNATRLQFLGLPNITQALRYSLDVIATNPLGAEGRESFALYAEHYPTVQQPIPDAVAGVDQPLRLTISGSSFSDLDNDVLSYAVTRADQSPLPNWLTFDAQALILSGTPLSAQIGNWSLLMRATDPSGGMAQQNFLITVRYLPVVSQPIGDIAPVREGRLLNYTLPANTFTDAGGATLRYNATQANGALLPTWLNFIALTQHFLGIPSSLDIGSLAVRVIADDGQGGQASVSFSFTITPNYPPALAKPISNSVASVNQPFRLVLPSDTFTDANNDPLNYTASQVDGSKLPRWLQFDEKTLTFSGMPGRSDTGDFSERIIPVRVTARDDRSSGNTQFNINVQGTSNIALFLAIATPIATILTGVFAAYQKRALCFNRYKKQRYQRLDVEVKAGEMFEYKFGDMSMQGKKVLAKTPRQLQGVSRFFLSPRERVPGSGDMPSWMVYDLDTNSVRSVVPVPDDSPPELIIQVKDEAGVVHEQFTLRVTGLKTAQTEQPTTDVELAPAAAL